MFGKGIHEIEPGKRGFKFGTYAAGVTQRTTGKKITEVLAKMFDIEKVEGKEEGEDGFTLRESANTIGYLLAYFHGAACSYANSKGLTEPTQSEVGDWIDDIGFQEAMKIYNESLKSPNVQPPAKAPGNTSA
ncbi:MAG TPA: hypothetical protein VK508_01755 [Cyclobacteriaceae bacterium]|nr:hypothetical protein [Cyclobacteriaceae bacterium]